MKAGKTMRAVLDGALTVMLVFEMFIQFTGEFLHEVIGFAFFATVIVHLAFSASWMRGTARAAKTGRIGGKRKALAIMGCLLGLAALMLGVSSVAISGILASAGFVWPLGSYALWANIHAFAAYAFCALVVVHLAMHWAFLAKVLKVPYDPARRRAISTGVSAVAAVGVAALGVAAAKAGVPQALASSAAESDTADDAESADVSNRLDSAGIEPTIEEQEKTPAASAAPERQTTSGKHGKRGRKGGNDEEPADSEEEPSEDAAEEAVEEAPAETYEEPYVAEPEETASGPLGICTLCRKQCPLSAPRCDKPYQAGLI